MSSKRPPEDGSETEREGERERGEGSEIRRETEGGRKKERERERERVRLRVVYVWDNSDVRSLNLRKVFVSCKHLYIFLINSPRLCKGFNKVALHYYLLQKRSTEHWRGLSIQFLFVI